MSDNHCYLADARRNSSFETSKLPPFALRVELQPLFRELKHPSRENGILLDRIDFKTSAMWSSFAAQLDGPRPQGPGPHHTLAPEPCRADECSLFASRTLPTRLLALRILL